MSNAKAATSTHPLVPILLLIAVLAGLIGGGSYVSSQRSQGRAAATAGAAAPGVPFLAVGR